MAQPLTPAAAHRQYDEGMTAFRRQIADPAARVAFGRDADGFMRQCACGVWHTDQGMTPLHVEYYNAIYSKGNPVPTALYWELASQVENYPGFALAGAGRPGAWEEPEPSFCRHLYADAAAVRRSRRQGERGGGGICQFLRRLPVRLL